MSNGHTLTILENTMRFGEDACGYLYWYSPYGQEETVGRLCGSAGGLMVQAPRKYGTAVCASGYQFDPIIGRCRYEYQKN
jgi:hypothetical protein